MNQGIDESTRLNAYGNDDFEWGYLPGFGTYRRGNFVKTKKSDPNESAKESQSSMTFTWRELYHDEAGKLRLRTIKYKLDEDGNRIMLANEL